MLVKSSRYGVRSSRTGFTTKVSGSLAAPSPDRSAVVEGDPSRDSGLVPAQSVVEVPFLELLADVVVGCNVLRPRRPSDLPGDEDGAHGLVREFDESTLHEGNDRRVISVGRDHHLKICPRRMAVRGTCRLMR